MSSEGFKVEYFGERSHGPVLEVDLEEGEILYNNEDIAIMVKSLFGLLGLRETEEIADAEAGQSAYDILLESGIEPGQKYTRSAGAFGTTAPGIKIEVYDDEDELEMIDDVDRTMVEYAVERLEVALELEE